MKRNLINLLFIGLLPLLFSCNKEQKKTSVQQIKPIVEKTDKNFELNSEGGIDASYVCMVNNKYMGEKQIVVEYKRKTYYGCCEMCVKRIQNNKQIRWAIDPYSGVEVDKATAFIGLVPESKSDVKYFQTKENYELYKMKN